MLRNTETKNEEPDSKRKKSSIDDDTYLWHLRLRCINLNRIQRLVKDGSISSLEVQPLPICESGLQEKMIKRPFTGKGQTTQECLELIHIDVCGPLNIHK